MQTYGINVCVHPNLLALLKAIEKLKDDSASEKPVMNQGSKETSPSPVKFYLNKINPSLEEPAGGRRGGGVTCGIRPNHYTITQ